MEPKKVESQNDAEGQGSNCNSYLFAEVTAYTRTYP